MNFNVTGSDRKRLVSIISKELGEKSRYMGMPSMAYTIGSISVDIDGGVGWGDTDPAIIQRITDALVAEGFEGEETEPYNGEELTAAEMDGLTIGFPMDGFDEAALDRLQKLVGSKAGLIRKALGAQDLRIRVEDGKVEFPWWSRLPSPEETQAYMAFLTALCTKAKESQRVTAKEREVESEKFAFRVFLLSLGFSGSEHKELRSILMKHLAGPAAFPTFAAANEFSAKQKEKRAAAKS